MLNKREKQLVKEYANKLVKQRQLTEGDLSRYSDETSNVIEKFKSKVGEVFEDVEVEDKAAAYPIIYKTLCGIVKKQFEYYTKQLD